MNPGEKAHQGLMTPNSCVEISPRKFNIFPIDLILKVIVILICFSPLDCKADFSVSLIFLWWPSLNFSCGGHLSKNIFSQCSVCCSGNKQIEIEKYSKHIKSKH